MTNQTETQKVRYEMRNAIENIVKEQNIDRMKFHEVAKSDYERIIRKVYYSFCDYKKYTEIQLDYMWTRLRTDLKHAKAICTNWNDWNSYIDNLDKLISENKPLEMYYLIVDGGWVYEGTLSEIKKVLYEYPNFMEDFYFFSKNYSWLIIHCDDGACMVRYEQK